HRGGRAVGDERPRVRRGQGVAGRVLDAAAAAQDRDRVGRDGREGGGRGEEGGGRAGVVGDGGRDRVAGGILQQQGASVDRRRVHGLVEGDRDPRRGRDLGGAGAGGDRVDDRGGVGR